MPTESHRPPHHRSSMHTRLQIGAISALLLVGALVLAGYSWTHPETTTPVRDYVQTGSLTYGASSDVASAYGPEGLLTGEPAYLKVVRGLAIRYTYRLSSRTSSHLLGTEQLDAELSNNAGLTRTIPLQPVTQFRGASFTTSVTLNFGEVRSLAATFARIVGRFVDGSYDLSLEPNIAIHGQIGSSQFKGAFDAPTDFVLAGTVLTTARGATPEVSSAGSPVGTPTIGQPIVARSSGSILGPSAKGATIFRGISVAVARLASFILALASFIALVLVASPWLRAMTSSDERARVDARLNFHSFVVEVEALPDAPSLTVDVRSFSGLQQVARRLECPVLHLRGPAIDMFAVVDSGTVYRYGIVSPRRPSYQNGNGHVPAHASPR
jgi:hypothetical protein